MMTRKELTPSPLSSKTVGICSALLSSFIQAEPLHAESLLENNIINRFYSNAELKIKLATKPNWQACQEAACVAANAAFDQRIQILGKTLQSRWQTEAELVKKNAANFHFSVADKVSLGTLSDSSATIIVFRSLQESGLPDHVLSFLIAREMGHVETHHHDKNVATKLFISAIASVLFPAVVFVSASSAAQQASTATTVISNAASTATSMLGGEVAMKKAQPSQLREADDWAISLLGLHPTDMSEMASLIHDYLEKLLPSQKNGWVEDLEITARYLQEKAMPPAQQKSGNQPTSTDKELVP